MSEDKPTSPNTDPANRSLGEFMKEYKSVPPKDEERIEDNRYFDRRSVAQSRGWNKHIIIVIVAIFVMLMFIFCGISIAKGAYLAAMTLFLVGFFSLCALSVTIYASGIDDA